jgi:cytochrome c peroxidase
VLGVLHRSRLISLAILGLLSCCLALGFSQVLAIDSQAGRALAAEPDFVWDLPEWAPKPVVPADNPMTQAKVELGRHLFYEKRLSVNGKQSCASCHIQALAFTGYPQKAKRKSTRNDVSMSTSCKKALRRSPEPCIVALVQR